MQNDTTLRGLIRLLPPIAALREQLEKSLHLESFAGTGDIAVNSLKGLQSAIAQLAPDAYVAALAPIVPEGAGDREKVSLALLIAAQLQAYVEGETGLPGAFRSGGGGSIQTAPNISINAVHGVPNIGAVMEKALALSEKDTENVS
ncbi:MAG: hypothetical protein SFU56_19625 [Capsulimonadales bacterium]|nr:hypothetical protein [Capsulimonadales bacterium]